MTAPRPRRGRNGALLWALLATVVVAIAGGVGEFALRAAPADAGPLAARAGVMSALGFAAALAAVAGAWALRVLAGRKLRPEDEEAAADARDRA